jgi:hypothetical protein
MDEKGQMTKAEVRYDFVSFSHEDAEYIQAIQPRVILTILADLERKTKALHKIADLEPVSGMERTQLVAVREIATGAVA